MRSNVVCISLELRKCKTRATFDDIPKYNEERSEKVYTMLHYKYNIILPRMDIIKRYGRT